MFGVATRSTVLVGVERSVASAADVGSVAREATMRRLPIELVNVVAPTPVSSTMAPRTVDELAGEKHRSWSR
jgi:hypothetical protein